MDKSADGLSTAAPLSANSDTALSERTDIELSIDPEESFFPPVAAGKSDHMVVNYTKTRLALKAKCSNNEVFRVNPVFQVIEANKCKNLSITRSPGFPIKKGDKVVVVYAPCDEKVTDLKAFFKELEAKKEAPKYVKIAISVESDVKKPNLDR